MLTSFYFLISFFLCFILLFTLKKVHKPLSFTNSIILCYIMLLCFCAVSVLPLALLSIPINLTTVSIIYNILSVVLLLQHKKNKERQLYYFDKFDIANFVIMLLFILIVFLRVFSFDIKLAYFNTDIANHFEFAMSIIRTGKLNTMYFASLNNAIFIELLTPIFDGVNTYKSMIIAETISNFLSGMIFYVLISYKKHSKQFKYISPILMILYFVGWPLYQYALGGFVYWGIGVTLFLFGLYLLYLYQDFPSIRRQLLALLLVVIYCIAICYVLFIPYVLALYLLCYIVLSLKNSSDTKPTKRLIGVVFTIGIIGSVILISILYLYFGDFNIFSTFLARDGGIHKELYRDYIYFIPFICYIGAHYKKHNEFNLNYLCLKIYLFFILISCLLCLIGIVSPYYYYKFYFILWALVWLVTCDAIDKLFQESHSWIYSYSGILLFLFAFTFTPLENIFIEKGLIQNSVVEYPLYSAVGSYLKNPRETIFDDDDYWELLYYLDENSLNIPIITDNDYYYWYNSFFDVDHYTSQIFETDFSNIPDIFVIDKESSGFITYENILNTNYKILFDNSFATIYKK